MDAPAIGDDGWPSRKVVGWVGGKTTTRNYGQTPILFKRNDDQAIWFIPNARCAVNSAKFDQLQLLCKVVESLGTTVMG